MVMEDLEISVSFKIVFLAWKSHGYINQLLKVMDISVVNNIYFSNVLVV